MNSSFANATTIACALASMFLYLKQKQAQAPKSSESRSEEKRLKLPPGVNQTALMVAAARAIETARPAGTRLFSDPYAALLCQTSTEELQKRMQAEDVHGFGGNVMSVRTLYIDREIEKAVNQGLRVRQIVNLGAGMDTRAFRLNLPADLTFFELDMKAIINYKNTILQNNNATPTCKRVTLCADLTVRDETRYAKYHIASNEWVAALLNAGFNPKETAFFLLEGLVTYLEKEQVEHLIGTIHDLASPGSNILVSTLHSSFLKKDTGSEIASRMKERGAEWKYACDDPATLIKSHGWNCVSCMSIRQLGDFCGPEAAARVRRNQNDSYFFTLGLKMVSASTIDDTD